VGTARFGVEDEWKASDPIRRRTGVLVCGALFVFFGRRKDALKVFFFDGSGLCVFYKRLDRGTFRIPAAFEEGTRSMVIDERVLEDLLDGIDVEGATKRH